MSASTPVTSLSGILLAALCGASEAADWPPTIDTANPVTTSKQGRAIERFIHGSKPEWGYPAMPAWTPTPAERISATEAGPAGQHLNSFYVVSPTTPRPNAPLVVWLHSANRSGFVYLGYQFLDTGNPRYTDGGNVSMPVPDDYYGLYLNSTNDEWWGWGEAQRNRAAYEARPTPGERRVLDTITWVADTYHIDRNRIYLCGLSMGGCGALGIGLSRGDLFAAMMVWVPAGVGYADFRRGFPPAPKATATQAEHDAWLRRISGADLPDPPPVVDLSSPADQWSKDQGLLLDAAEAGRLPLILGWGPAGHSEFRKHWGESPAVAPVLNYPWLAIRKNVAYPVFTHASCNQRAPWRSAADFDTAGQMNAWFRWESQHDHPRSLTMRLWLVPEAPPDTANVDITPRRLQQFVVRPGTTYVWHLVRDGHPVATGVVQADVANLLTIPQLALSKIPADLTISAADPKSSQ